MKNHAQARVSKQLRRLTVSLPEDLVKKVKHISRESGQIS
jgi:metal-responsive CopG/Arc/MetJ family transcriptional regulator